MRDVARLNVEVPPELRDAVKVAAARRRLSIRLIVIEALEDWLGCEKLEPEARDAER